MIRVRLGTPFDDAAFFEVKFHCIRCGGCCVGTEMELLPEDIERIVSLGHKIEEFAVFDGERWRLRNVDGHCVFYDKATGLCKIYENRPIGCRLYPLQVSDDGVYVDKQCPTWHTVPRSELERLGPYLPLFVKRSLETSLWIRLRFPRSQGPGTA